MLKSEGSRDNLNTGPATYYLWNHGQLLTLYLSFLIYKIEY